MIQIEAAGVACKSAAMAGSAVFATDVSSEPRATASRMAVSARRSSALSVLPGWGCSLGGVTKRTITAQLFPALWIDRNPETAALWEFNSHVCPACQPIFMAVRTGTEPRSILEIHAQNTQLFGIRISAFSCFYGGFDGRLNGLGPLFFNNFDQAKFVSSIHLRPSERGDESGMGNRLIHKDLIV